MKKKGMLAIVLATTMIAGSSMAVMAADTVDTETTVSGSGTVSGDSDVSVVNKQVYSVGVPTTKTLKLYVDPQGLYGLADGETLTDAEAEERAGKIFCLSKMPVHNMSSIDIKVNVEMELGGDAGVTVAADKDAVNTGTDTKVLLYAAPTKTGITEVTTDAGNLSEYVAPENGIIVPKTTPAELEFVLPKATDYKSHNISGDFVYKKDEATIGNGTAIAFGGWVNKNADWKDFDKKAQNPKSITMNAVYTYAAATPQESASTALPGTAFMVSANGADTVEIPASDTPSGSQSVTFIRGTTTTDPTFTIPLPSGASSAATPTISVVGTGSNTTPKTPAAGTVWTYNATTGKLVFLRGSTPLASGWTADTYTCTLTFSNNTTEVVTLIIQ